MTIINIIVYMFHQKQKNLLLNFKVNYMICMLKKEIKFLLKKDYDYKFIPNSSGASIFKIKRREGSTLKGKILLLQLELLSLMLYLLLYILLELDYLMKIIKN